MSPALRRRLLLLLPLLFAACGDRSPGTASRASERDSLQPAPAYAAVDLAGDTVSLASLRGSPVLLNLWATWCPPCREEMPSLQRVHRDYRERGLRVVAVSVDNAEARDAITRFVAEYGIDFTILHDPQDRASRTFRTFGLPETFLIDARGLLVRRWRGKVDGDSREVRRVLDRVTREGEGDRDRDR